MYILVCVIFIERIVEITIPSMRLQKQISLPDHQKTGKGGEVMGFFSEI